MSDDEVLQGAYQRLRSTGPEFEGWLSNHGPMAVEAMVRHGHADAVGGWAEAYAARLEDAPRPVDAITATTWRDALGDPRRLGDWPVYFDRLLTDAHWSEVLATWWPRLLPGIAAGATHGVIRTGHAARTLLGGGAMEPAVAELAQALGYWAARWQPVPVTPPVAAPSHEMLAPAAALAAVPRLPEQTGGINDRLGRLGDLDGWGRAQAAVAAPTSAEGSEAFLRAVVRAAVGDYARHGHGEPVMLVHAATAPNAVLRALPALPRELWAPSARTAWAATTAVRAAYASVSARPVAEVRHTPADLMAAAVDNGDEHLIKLADTALDVHRWTGDVTALAAVARGVDLLRRA